MVQEKFTFELRKHNPNSDANLNGGNSWENEPKELPNPLCLVKYDSDHPTEKTFVNIKVKMLTIS
jgi:hypothetical protein